MFTSKHERNRMLFVPARLFRWRVNGLHSNDVSKAVVNGYSEREEKDDIRLVYKDFTRQGAIIPFESLFLFIIGQQVEVGNEKERYVREFKEKIVEWSFGKDKTLALNEL